MTQVRPVETAEITVQFVNDPKPGKKWGSVKDTNGNYYGGPPGMLRQFQVGETCKIEFELGGNDGTLKALKHKVAIPQALARPVAVPPRARTNPVDSEQIFVTALMKGFLNQGDTATDIIGKINILRDAYRNTFGGSEKQRDDQMNDEIPF
jgi:hypothetical protein